ncbi:MAG: cytochrome c biogenesis protein CcsA [Desulfovibrio sp.]|nr:cytochrome c biogenesis protein CcsA [Desulfovibrio sp.]
MYIFAYLCLLVSLLCALGGGFFALLQLLQDRNDHLKFAASLNIGVFSGLALASAMLLHALFWSDFSLEYVFSYTDSLLPVFYRLTAFWAGQPGSMLFWALAAAFGGLVFYFVTDKTSLSPSTSLWFWVLFYAVMAFFCLVLTCWSNPFLLLRPAPTDGSGLNPLLQNPGMIFHPPLLFLGYAFFTVPACLALAQTITGDDAKPWFSITGNYIRVSWLLLSSGIILGAWWAYMELGWGGYWAWDPVENASLFPWLVATAGMHTLVVSRSCAKLRRISALLVSMSVVCAFFATYLTRSGVIESVHAFGDGGVGTPLLIFVIASATIAVWSCARSPLRGESLASPTSREGLLLLTSWVFIALAAIILVATIWPVACQLLRLAPKGLDANFYNRVCLPLGAFLFLVLCLCPWLAPLGGFIRTRGLTWLLITIGAAFATMIALWIADYRVPLALISSGAAVGVLCAMLIRLFFKSSWKSRSAFDSLWIHAGMALVALGVAFSGAYSVDREVFLSPGKSEKVGRYDFALDKIEEGTGAGYDFLKARLSAKSGDQTLGALAPERRIYAKFGAMQFSEVDVISRLGEDIYVSLLGVDEDYRVLVKISIQPLVNWIWIGGVVVCVFPVFGFFIRRPETTRRN